MKPIFITLFLALLLSGCKKDNGYQNSGTIIGPDYRKCMCCGGWFIRIDKDTLRFDIRPEGFNVNLDSLGYPVEVYLDWHHKDPKCLADEIIVDRMEVKKDSAKENWIQLFNGKNLDGWDIKIAGYPINENFNNTFRVEDGVLKACYDKYNGFNGEYGHIFYKTTFSKYKIRLEYRFVGEQTTGGAGWAFRNSGIMLHSQSAASMEKDQSFPTSIEFQLLGGSGEEERPTGNLCTPGTNVEMKDSLFTPHCINSSSKTYNGDQWVTAEAIVYGDSVIFHVINGDTVLSYQKPQLDERDATYAKLFALNGTKYLKEGYIALQGESHPVEFRKVELLDLSKKK